VGSIQVRNRAQRQASREGRENHGFEFHSIGSDVLAEEGGLDIYCRCLEWRQSQVVGEYDDMSGGEVSIPDSPVLQGNVSGQIPGLGDHHLSIWTEDGR